MALLRAFDKICMKDCLHRHQLSTPRERRAIASHPLCGRAILVLGAIMEVWILSVPRCLAPSHHSPIEEYALYNSQHSSRAYIESQFPFMRLFLSLYAGLVHKLISWRISHNFEVRDSKGALQHHRFDGNTFGENRLERTPSQISGTSISPISRMLWRLSPLGIIVIPSYNNLQVHE